MGNGKIEPQVDLSQVAINSLAHDLDYMADRCYQPMPGARAIKTFQGILERLDQSVEEVRQQGYFLIQERCPALESSLNNQCHSLFKERFDRELELCRTNISGQIKSNAADVKMRFLAQVGLGGSLDDGKKSAVLQGSLGGGLQFGSQMYALGVDFMGTPVSTADKEWGARLGFTFQQDITGSRLSAILTAGGEASSMPVDGPTYIDGERNPERNRSEIGVFGRVGLTYFSQINSDNFGPESRFTHTLFAGYGMATGGSVLYQVGVQLQ